MKYATIILMLLPALLCAQEFEFRQEYDSISVEIDGWSPYQPWMGGYSWSHPDWCDIDNDSDLDFFVGKFVPHTIDYYQNCGTAISSNLVIFALAWDSIYSFGAGSNTDFADLDGDGDLDVLIGSGGVAHYENMGNATQPQFSSQPDTLLDTQGNVVLAFHVALVDIDADGDDDLFGGEYEGHLQFYRNIGTPDSFAFYLESNLWLNISAGAQADPTFCDIDGDGDQDLFIGNEIGRIYFYRNDGTAQQYNFTYMTDYYNSIDVGEYASPEFADIDGDGDYDLFVGREQMSTTIDPGDIFFYENVGSPQVAQWNLVTKNYISLDVGYTAQSAMIDINADQDKDLFNQHTGDYLSYYENTGSADSAAYLWITDNYQNISIDDAFPEFGDLDGDQDPDLLMGEGAIPGPPNIYLFQNRGTPQNASFSLYSSDYIPGVFTQASVINAIALADIDADGDLDMFTSDQDRHLYFFQNNGTAQSPLYNLITTNWQNVFQPSTPTMLMIPTFYDIDEDGDLDLFCGTLWGWNQLWFYRNNGTAQNPQMALETQTFMGPGFLHFTGVDIFDVDQDGDGDFMMSTYNGGMVFYRNTTGEASAPPPVQRHPQAGLQISLGPNPANPFVVASF
ncbi:MAG TPA: VCBS repeat-containing protein, partial [bacterium]